MKPVWRVVFLKEMRETLRDRRTLVMMIVIPVLLYPVLLIVIQQLLLLGRRNLEAEAVPVAVAGEAPPVLRDLIEAEEGLFVVPAPADLTGALRGGAVAAVAVVGPEEVAESSREVTILFDAASDQSQRGRAALDDVVTAWSDSVLASRLRLRGLPGGFARPVEVADSSVALPTEVGGYALGRFLPLLLVVITLLGAFYPAVDLAAGEKERGTLEPLLTAPVHPRFIVAGKFVTVALIGITAAALNLTSMILTFQTGILQVAGDIGLDFALPFSAVALIFLTLVPLAVLFGAVFLGLAVRASSFKEAQNSLTPVYMLVLVPAMLPLFPGIEFGPVLAVTPVANVAFLFQHLMRGDADPLLGALVLSSTTLFALLSLLFAGQAFGSERVLFGSDEDQDEVSSASWLEQLRAFRRRATVPRPVTVLMFVAFLAVVFFMGGIQLQLRFGEPGILYSQWLLLFAPAALLMWVGGYDTRQALSLRAPPALGVLGAVLMIAGAIPLVWLLGWLQTFVLPVPWDLLEGLQDLVTAESLSRLLWLLLILAVTPAFCEEIVFRGVLLGGTKGRLKPWRLIVLNGVVFGLFHLSFETIIRFLPSATLGMVIAFAVWRTGSIWVGSLMHFLNNGTIVMFASVPSLQAVLADPEAPPPLWILPVAALALAAGVRILLGLRPPEPVSNVPPEQVPPDAILPAEA